MAISRMTRRHPKATRSDRQPGRKSNVRDHSDIIVLPAGKRLEVWLCPAGRTTRRLGTVGVGLATDARRYGQDLIGELIEKAMKELERGATRTFERAQ